MENISNLKDGAHIHLMGICGTAMASLAGLLKERGFKITGSDQNVYPPMSTFLQDLGVEIMQGYKKENLSIKPDYVVVGNVIAKRYEEAQALLESDIPYGSLPEALRDLIIQDRHSMVVAGTHGKTTTTSMLAWITEKAGLKPGFLIGGIAKNFSLSYQNPKAHHFVIEGDEYDTAFFAKVPKFIHYKPQSVILTGIEFDHADIYDDLNDVIKAFESLVKIIPTQSGLLVYNAEDKNIPKVLPHYQGVKVSYGFKQGDWTTDHIEFLRNGIEFDVLHKGKKQDRILVPMFGQYNVINALSVYALSKELGLKVDLKTSFASFKGVKRRQELIGEPGGIQVIEDFAHHPTAVKATIESFKKRKNAGKLVVVFEPRSNTSRRKLFQRAYTEALSLADQVFLSEPFVGAITVAGDNQLDTSEVVSDLSKTIQAQSFQNVDDILDPIKNTLREGDTLLIMSNGGFQGIYQKILGRLSK